MNELLFLIHLFFLILLSVIAAKIGKETLISFAVLQGLLANLFVQKQTYLFGLEVTCADPYAVASLLCANLLQEHYGKEATKNLFQTQIILSVTFALMAKVHLFYSPSLHDTVHPAFFQILDLSPRILFLSLAISLFVQKLDIELFAKFRAHFFPYSFSLSAFSSVFIAQSIDTFLFTFIALYGIGGSLFQIFFMSLFLKGITLFFMSSFSQWTKRLIRL